MIIERPPDSSALAANSRATRIAAAAGTPYAAGAAAETGLSVDEADRRLGALAEDGHLEMRVRGGGIFYALWDADREAP